MVYDLDLVLSVKFSQLSLLCLELYISNGKVAVLFIEITKSWIKPQLSHFVYQVLDTVKTFLKTYMIESSLDHAPYTYFVS